MPEQFIETTNIQRLCLYDGPGVRTTIFLKGCYLDCPWCCNPETKSNDIQYYIYPEKCWRNRQEQYLIPKICCNCDLTQAYSCLYGVYEVITKKWDVNFLFNKIIQDKDFWGEDGGVTLSGGEPLMQSEVLLPLVQKLKENDIHIVMETSLFAPTDKLTKIEPYIDMFIVDVKTLEKPYVAKKYKNERLNFTNNIQYLSSMNKINTIRMVLIERITTTSENITKLQQLTNEIIYNNLEFLEYHTLGNKKAERVGLVALQFEKPNTEDVRSLLAKFSKARYLKI